MQLLQEILERNGEEIARVKERKESICQSSLARCVAYVLSIVRDWLPFVTCDELFPFDRTSVYEIAKRCLLALFDPEMYPTGIVCFESACIFQIPSLFSLKSWSQVVDALIRVSFSYVYFLVCLCSCLRFSGNSCRVTRYLGPLPMPLYAGFLMIERRTNICRIRPPLIFCCINKYFLCCNEDK